METYFIMGAGPQSSASSWGTGGKFCKTTKNVHE